MPAILLSGVGAEPKSLSDFLFLTDAPMTILTSKLQVGETLGKEKHTYKVGRRRDPIESATPDGAPPSPTEGADPEYEVDVRVGFFEGKAGVGKFAKHKVDYAQTVAATPGKNKGKTGALHLAKAKAQQLRRIKWGMEKKALGDDESAAETATAASKYRGLGKTLQTTAQTDLPIDSNVRTPTGQIYTGTVADFTEAALIDAMQSRWDSTQYAAELLGLFGSDLKERVGVFNRREPTISNYTTTIRYNSDEAKTMRSGVDLYHGDFGEAEFMLASWMPNAKRGYLLELEQCQKLPFGPGMAEEALGKDGSGDAVVLWAMFAVLFGDPRAHIKFAAT